MDFGLRISNHENHFENFLPGESFGEPDLQVIYYKSSGKIKVEIKLVLRKMNVISVTSVTSQQLLNSRRGQSIWRGRRDNDVM